MKRTTLDRVAQARGSDNETAVMCADKALCPDMTRLPIHFDFCDLSHNRLAPKRVSNAAPGQDGAFTDRFRRWSRVPAVSLRSSLENRNGAGAPKSAVIVRIGLQ